MMPPSRHFPSGHAGHFGSPIYLKLASASLVQACGLSLLLHSQVRARVATATEAAASNGHAMDPWPSPLTDHTQLAYDHD